MKLRHLLCAGLCIAESVLSADTFSYINLRQAANMGFRDDAPKDQKGGWTDQGKSNDLRSLPLGEQNLDGVPFHIIDPASNNGKSCIMLRGVERPYFPLSAEVKTSATGKYLYLLHATAFAHYGKNPGCVTVNYFDGAKDSFVLDHTQVGDWWHPVNRKNCSVAWQGRSETSDVGLYCTELPLKEKQLRSIQLKSGDGSAWGIVAMTVSSKRTQNPKKSLVIDMIGEKWQPIDYHFETAKGSVLDFSSRLDAPAGKYGQVVVCNGHFEFEKKPGTPVRFYGTNTCANINYMSKKWCHRLADRLAKYGFNIVRIHHHDGGSVVSRTTKINESEVKKMDYWIYALAQRGIYITTDIFCSRWVGPGEIPEMPKGISDYNDYKALFLIYDSVYNNFITYMRNILNHKNEFTGYKWKDDPAIVSFSLLNEDALNANWTKPSIKKLFIKKFEEYCKFKGLSSAGGSDNPEFPAFLYSLYNKRLTQIRAELVKIGCRKPISDMNCSNGVFLTLPRIGYDYVDIHHYYDHPQKNEKTGERRQMQNSSIAEFVEMPGTLFPQRFINKPFAITEVEFAGDNVYRSEGAAILGTYSALQDWDMIVQFCYAHNFDGVKKSTKVSGFDILIDPMRNIAHRFAASQFLDGSFKKAEKSIVVALAPEPIPAINSKISQQIRTLGLICRLGVIVTKEIKPGDLPADTALIITTEYAAPVNKTKIPVIKFTNSDHYDLLDAIIKKGILPRNSYDPVNAVFRSLSGQLEVDVLNKKFKGVSDKCEVFVLPKNSSGKGKYMSVSNVSAFCTIGIVSPDEKKLIDANRLLLMHNTNSSKAGKTFLDDSRKISTESGTVPHLIASGTADVELGLPGNWDVWAIDTAGKRLAQLPVKNKKGKKAFRISVFNKFGQVIGYELKKVREGQK